MAIQNKAYYLRSTSEISLEQLYTKLSHKVYNSDVDMVLNNHFKKGVVKVVKVFSEILQTDNYTFDLKTEIFKISFTKGEAVFIYFKVNNGPNFSILEIKSVRPKKITKTIYVDS